MEVISKEEGLKGIVGHQLGKGGFMNRVWEDDREECWVVLGSGKPGWVYASKVPDGQERCRMVCEYHGGVSLKVLRK